MAHGDIGPELATRMPARLGTGHQLLRLAQAHQLGAQGFDELLRVVQREVQFAQQHVQRRLAIEFEQQVAVHRGDHAFAVDRLRALRDARDQGHVGSEGHATETAVKHAAGRALTTQVAGAAECELHALGPAAGQAAEHMARRRAVRDFGDQFGQIGSAGVGVHQGSVRHKAAAR